MKEEVLNQYRITGMYDDKLYLRFIVASSKEEAEDIFNNRIVTNSELLVELVKEG